ncbi:MAG: flagellar biosynthesis anti-sigma factor FlgM [Bdellovibrionota bacterium]
MDITKLGSDRIQQERAQDAAQTQKSQGAKSSEKTDANSVAQNSKSVKSSTASNVKWSADAQLASEALAIAKNAPETRSDKVAALKAAIANGSYKVDSKKVADRMVERSLEDDLLSRNG